MLPVISGRDTELQIHAQRGYGMQLLALERLHHTL
jgi:hypothetical protein